MNNDKLYADGDKLFTLDSSNDEKYSRYLDEAFADNPLTPEQKQAVIDFAKMQCVQVLNDFYKPTTNDKAAD